MERVIWKVIIHRLPLNDGYGPDTGEYTRHEIYFDTLKDASEYITKCCDAGQPIIRVEMNEIHLYGKEAEKNYETRIIPCY